MRLYRYSGTPPAPHRIRNSAQSSTHSHYRHLTHVSDIILLIILPCSVTPTKLPTARAAPWVRGAMGRGQAEVAWIPRTRTHTLTHSLIERSHQIAPSGRRENFTQRQSRDRSRLSSAHLELLCSCVSLDM